MAWHNYHGVSVSMVVSASPHVRLGLGSTYLHYRSNGVLVGCSIHHHRGRAGWLSPSKTTAYTPFHWAKAKITDLKP